MRKSIEDRAAFPLAVCSAVFTAMCAQPALHAEPLMSTRQAASSWPDTGAFAPASVCSMQPLLQDYQVLGSQQILVNWASLFPGSQSRNGNVALLVGLTGIPSQGVVLLEGNALSLVAGVGDPTPVGGTFGAMIFVGENVPVVNARGDVLFLSDVNGAVTSRGLFLYERTNGVIHCVSAIGDPTPIGGVFGSVGLGTLNDNGEVAFFAWRNSYQDTMILRWKAGVVTKIVAIGDPAPNATAFLSLSMMGFGSPLILGWPPRIRNDGHVFFVADVTGNHRGLYEEFNGQITRLAGSLDPAPGGGTMHSYQAPIPNESGEIAFLARHQLSTTDEWTWFRGRPGQFERVLGKGDMITGKQVVAMTGSGGPYSTPFHDGGNLLMTLGLRDPVTLVQSTALVMHRRGLPADILVEVGDMTAMGAITKLTAYAPVTSNSVALVGMEVSTVSGPLDVHMAVEICVPPGPSTYCTAKTNSAGCVPQISSEGMPSATAPIGFVVRAEQVLNAKPGFLLYSTTGPASTPFGGGTLCMTSPIKRAPAVSAGGTLPPIVDCTGVFQIDMNAFAAGVLGGSPSTALSSPGTTVYCQWYGRDSGFPAPSNVQLSDALEYAITP